MTSSITKKCNKCKRALSVEVFGDNGCGECFKTCDACRSRNRVQHARTALKKQMDNDEDEQ